MIVDRVVVIRKRQGGSMKGLLICQCGHDKEVHNEQLQCCVVGCKCLGFLERADRIDIFEGYGECE